MQYNNAAQQRPGEKPASAPKASQIRPRAQGQAYIPIPTLKHLRSRHEDTKAASLTDRNMDTHIIHIRGAHSPAPRLDLTTHAKQQTQQQPYGPAGMLGQNSELFPWLARHHLFGEGYGQASSVLRPEQGTEQGMLPRHATQELQQKPVPNQYKKKSAELQQITWTIQASQPDTDKHPLHTALPAPRHPRHDSDHTLNSRTQTLRADP